MLKIYYVCSCYTQDGYTGALFSYSDSNIFKLRVTCKREIISETNVSFKEI